VATVLASSAVWWSGIALAADLGVPICLWGVSAASDGNVCPAPLGLVFMFSQVILGLASEVVRWAWEVADRLHNESGRIDVGRYFGGRNGSCSERLTRLLTDVGGKG
jgi:hypothetical protein